MTQTGTLPQTAAAKTAKGNNRRVYWTLDGDAGQATMTTEELAVLQDLASKNPNLKITKVDVPTRRRSR